MTSKFKGNVTRIDVVFDIYWKESIKGSAREKRDTGIGIKVSQKTPVNPKWKQFLCDDDNKTELFKLLAQDLASIIMESRLFVLEDLY